MAEPKDADATMEDEYDEEADSDFDAGNASAEMISSSSDEAADQPSQTQRGQARTKLQTKGKGNAQPPPELDSGDEATIQERNSAKQKQKQKGEDDPDDNSDIEEQGWRARTRGMLEKKQAKKGKSKLASVKGSSIDVDQIWEAMNRPGGLDVEPAGASVMDVDAHPFDEQKENSEPSDARSAQPIEAETGQRQGSQEGLNEMITIDETYEFAGEVHTRKKTVPSSSAEAKQWLAQRPYHSDPRFSGDEPVRRPLRKISRFDPNLNNLESFKKSWKRSLADGRGSKPQKLNTVEKSKMDWDAHVDLEGLQDELSEHAKAKEGYLGRMEFLGQVEQRKEEEVRRARGKV